MISTGEMVDIEDFYRGFAGSIYALAVAFYLFEIKAEPFEMGPLDVVWDSARERRCRPEGS